MKTILERIPENYSQDLINDINMYFDTYSGDLSGCTVYNQNFTIQKWYDIYETLKHLFIKYYIINDDNYDLEIPDTPRYGSGGFVRLNSKYKEKYVKDVYEIFIKSAYPQRINKLFLEGMESDDIYFPYIFNIMYEHIGKKNNASRLFINYVYGILTMNKEKLERLNFLPRVNMDITKEVAEYYSDILDSIDERLYYYVDTDGIYLKKENIDKVSKIFEDNEIEYDIEDKKSNYLFLDRKRYIEIGGKFNRDIKNIRGIKFIDFFNRCEIIRKRASVNK